MNKTFLILLTGISLLPAGCTMIPKYNRPEAPVSSAWPEGKAYPGNATGSDIFDPSQLSWREFFADEKLQQVIETALTNNRDLKLSSLNVELAQAMYGIQKASLFPAFDAVGSGSKSQASQDLTRPGESRTIESYSVSLGALSWEVDFFGRIRSLKARALEEYLASEQARRGAQILLISSVANAYLALAADQENLSLSENTLKNQQNAYALIDQQYKAGIITELDLRRSQTLVDSANLQVATYTQQVAKDKNALNLLVGSKVSSELLPAKLSEVNLTKNITPGLPSEVLLQRPDVLQAENNLKAANADIGQARAAFFPSISLTATLGSASNELSGLFKTGTDIWNFAPRAVMPIFDSRIWQAHKAAKVQQKMAVTQYEKSIQNAFREVADALAVRGTVDQQVSAQESLVKALSETSRLSKARYSQGIDSYLSVLDSETSLFAAEQGLTNLHLARSASHVKLYAVLGGGGDKMKE